MAKTYQLVAWTDKGRVKMIPAEINDFILGEMDVINRQMDRIRYGSPHEVGDLLRLSSAYEKLALQLLDLDQKADAFFLFSEAAHCCTASGNNWQDTEWGEMLCKPLRGRFFAMFCQCKDLVRKYPELRFAWDTSGLQRTCDDITYPDRVIEAEWEADSGDFEEARAFSKALQFGKNEVYRRRRA